MHFKKCGLFICFLSLLTSEIPYWQNGHHKRLHHQIFIWFTSRDLVTLFWCLLDVTWKILPIAIFSEPRHEQNLVNEKKPFSFSTNRSYTLCLPRQIPHCLQNQLTKTPNSTKLNSQNHIKELPNHHHWSPTPRIPYPTTTTNTL